jgi:hypothetical protein
MAACLVSSSWIGWKNNVRQSSGGHADLHTGWPRVNTTDVSSIGKSDLREYVLNGYEASFGSYEVNEAKHILTHHIQGANTRDLLVGKNLPRL